MVTLLGLVPKGKRSVTERYVISISHWKERQSDEQKGAIETGDTLAVFPFCCDQIVMSLSMVTLMGLEPMLSA